MKIKLVWIERDRRGQERQRREETLEAESNKPVTAKSALHLISRHHPEIALAGRTLLRNSDATKYRWVLCVTQLDSDRWLYVYADPVHEAAAVGQDA